MKINRLNLFTGIFGFGAFLVILGTFFKYPSNIAFILVVATLIASSWNFAVMFDYTKGKKKEKGR